MLLKLHREKLTKWLELLVDLRKLSVDLRTQVKDSREVFLAKSLTWQQLQALFKEEILTLTKEMIEPSMQSAWQSFQTESHRCLRLLTTDLLFLSSSKSPTTRQQRLSQIETRLDQMIAYGQNLLSSLKTS
jgi:hypothetical protein